MLNNRWILTAAHCIQDAEYVNKTSSVRLQINPANLTQYYTTRECGVVYFQSYLVVCLSVLFSLSKAFTYMYIVHYWCAGMANLQNIPVKFVY